MPQLQLEQRAEQSAIDPQTDDIAQVFNPRTNVWREHFAVVGAEIRGLTPIGRATARLLRLDSPDRIEARLEMSRDPTGSSGAQ